MLKHMKEVVLIKCLNFHFSFKLYAQDYLYFIVFFDFLSFFLLLKITRYCNPSIRRWMNR